MASHSGQGSAGSSQHVAIFRDGLQLGAARNLRPTPLLAMAVEISDQDVQESGPEECFGVDLSLRALFEAFVEFLLADDLGRPMEARSLFRLRHRKFEEASNHTGEFFTIFAERWIVGHHDHPLVNGEYAGSFGNYADHDRAAGVLCRHLILYDSFDDRVFE